MLFAEDRLTGHLVLADDEPEDVLGFSCPSCQGDVCFKAPRNVRFHFAHYPTASCDYGKDRESWRHQEIQYEIVNSLRRVLSKHPKKPKFKIEVEKRIGDRIADIFVQIKHWGIRWVIEIQRSPIGFTEIHERTNCFSANSCTTLWVIADQEIVNGQLPARWIQDLAHLHYGHAFVHVKKHKVRPVQIKRSVRPPLVSVHDDLISIFKLDQKQVKYFPNRPKMFCLRYESRLAQ